MFLKVTRVCCIVSSFGFVQDAYDHPQGGPERLSSKVSRTFFADRRHGGFDGSLQKDWN